MADNDGDGGGDEEQGLKLRHRVFIGTVGYAGAQAVPCLRRSTLHSAVLLCATPRNLFASLIYKT